MKILFAATPATGHVNPLLALVRMVRERGDTALFATGSHFADAVEAAGAKLLPLAEGADRDFREVEKVFPERAALPPGPEQLRFDFENVFLATMAPQAATLKAAIAMHAPDLVVTDTAFLGRLPLLLDRDRPRPPIVVCGVTVMTLPRPDGAPFGPGLPLARSDAERESYARIAADVERMMTGPLQGFLDAELAKLSLPPLPCPLMDAFTLMADAYLHGASPSFEYPVDSPPGYVSFIGALPPPPVQDLPLPAWWGELDGSRRVVLVTQGTVTNEDFGQLIEPTLAALADRDDVLMVVTTGRRPVGNIKGAIPANARLVPYVDLEAMLPRIDLLVTNGGFGTVANALRAGKPIVAAGRTEDKAEVGARVAWSGVGIEVPSQTPSPAVLRAAVDRVFGQPSYRARAEAIAAEMAAIDAPREVYRVFDALVGDAAQARAFPAVA